MIRRASPINFGPPSEVIPIGEWEGKLATRYAGGLRYMPTPTTMINGLTATMQIFVGPSDPFGSFFAMWAGSLKFRFFTDSPKTARTLMQVAYYPGLIGPAEDVHMGGISYPSSGEAVHVDAQSTINLATGPIPGSLPARELLFPLSTETQFADLNVPFYNTYERLTTDGEFYGHNGVLVVPFLGKVEASSYVIDELLEIYTSAGDDFRYSVFRPPLSIRFGVGVIGNNKVGTTYRNLNGLRSNHVPSAPPV